MVIVVLWWAYSYISKQIRSVMGTDKPATAAAVSAPADFKPDDLIRYVPEPGRAMTVSSDRTLDAVMSGKFGPAVVMIYAHWCVHCRNMMDAFEAAAAESSVQFVRVEGQNAPITARKV